MEEPDLAYVILSETGNPMEEADMNGASRKGAMLTPVRGTLHAVQSSAMPDSPASCSLPQIEPFGAKEICSRCKK